SARQLPDGIEAVRVHDEPLQLLTGPGHEFADAGAIVPTRLAGHRIWMPGVVAGTEWAAYYEDFAAAFGFTIEATGPEFGTEPLLDTLAKSPDLATFVGSETRLVWPPEDDLRRIDVHDPTPVYPHSLVWRGDNPHPALALLREHFANVRTRPGAVGTWVPEWAR
ncbi:LysR substrate-binding domain-containing protein, partial [Streptomyces sp. NPDC057654]|uniref:LysR substrate-binding domain-containing protein n=1 Tax=Streptomyces sp. NPDC057654 TaxID=3346196 RepID=UPI0036A0D9E2